VRSAIVVGSAGQDGSLLSDRLERDGWIVAGVDREVVTVRNGGGIRLPASIDVLDPAAVDDLVRRVSPSSLYYLAAYHHSSEDLERDEPRLLARSFDVNVRGLVNALESARTIAPRCRVFYAASSHVFGDPKDPIQDERTPMEPRSAYGITKAAGVHYCRTYREEHGMHASVGVLYNHESPLRAPSFVSRRIVDGARAARAYADRPGASASDAAAPRLRLGSLAAVVDWGFAPDYVDAMVRIVARDVPDDYVVATGAPHTVEDFVSCAFREVGLDFRSWVEESPGILRKPAAIRVGDARKLRDLTGWAPSVTFEEMVRRLVRAPPDR